MGGQLVGAFVVAIAHVLPGQVAATAQPFFRHSQFVGGGAAVHQHLDGVLAASFFVAPVEPVVGQTGIILQIRWDRRDLGIDARGALLQGQTGLGQLAGTVRYQIQHARRADVVAVPQEPVQPRRMMRFQKGAEIGQIGVLHLGLHRHGAPGHHDFGLTIAPAPRRDQRAAKAQRAFGCLGSVSRVE